MSMNQDTLGEVIRLAKEVQRLAADVKLAQRLHASASDEWQAKPPDQRGPVPWLYASPKVTGELRRRSMDLTRALARMRAS